MADETPAPLSDAEIVEIEGRELNAMAGPWDSSDRIGIGDSIELCDGEYILKGAGGETLAYVFADPDADFIAAARTDIPRLLATLAALERERAAMREIVAAVAGDHVHQWDAVDPQEVWACEICGENSHDWAEDVQGRARALLATQTPAPQQPAHEGEE